MMYPTPPAWVLALRPGLTVRAIRSRAIRIVLSGPKPTVGHGYTGVSLLKTGRSWTDPNPHACYDMWSFLQLFEQHGRRVMYAFRAEELARWCVFCEGPHVAGRDHMNQTPRLGYVGPVCRAAILEGRRLRKESRDAR